MAEQRILNGRYEVGELIGRGGMADVYRGMDLRLGRRVAIKMMRPDLARDPQFQSRFRREARSSAALNHPNVVSVFDTGEEELQDTAHHGVMCPFLVMEFVDGQTLRAALLAGDVAVKDAARWMGGVLAALDYSHRVGIVHRDIKPANIMVTRDGTVKVMDFGIARALADSAATMTQSQAVVGTAQYLSPEQADPKQADGEPVDARSDLYSAGCVLFELLTGRPPFVADSQVAMAYQHVHKKPPTPSALNPTVTTSLDTVVATALAKSPEHRYQSGAEFSRALERAGTGQDDDATTTLPISPGARASASGTAALAGAGLATAGTARAGTGPGRGADGRERFTAEQDPYSASAPEPVTRALQTVPDDARTGSGASGRDQLEYRAPHADQHDTAGWTAGDEPGHDHGAHTQRNRRRGRRRAAVGVLIVLLAIGAVVGGWFLIEELNRRNLEANQVSVPEVRELSQVDAQNTLMQADLRPVVEQVYHDEVGRDLAVGTEPAAGTTVPRDREITLQISQGPDHVDIPADLAGQSEATVRDTLEGLGLSISSVRDVPSSTVPRDRLVQTSPELGSTVRSGASVELRLSNGMAEIPSLVGLSIEEARGELEGAGLRMNEVEESSAEAEPGTVTEQDPPAGNLAPQNSSVTVTVAVRPEPSPSPTSESPSPSPSPTSESPSPSPSPTSESPSPTDSDDPTDEEASAHRGQPSDPPA